MCCKEWHNLIRHFVEKVEADLNLKWSRIVLHVTSHKWKLFSVMVRSAKNRTKMSLTWSQLQKQFKSFSTNLLQTKMKTDGKTQRAPGSTSYGNSLLPGAEAWLHNSGFSLHELKTSMSWRKHIVKFMSLQSLVQVLVFQFKKCSPVVHFQHFTWVSRFIMYSKLEKFMNSGSNDKICTLLSIGQPQSNLCQKNGFQCEKHIL